MTLKEANQIYYINKEIESIQRDISDLESSVTYLKAVTYSDMPKNYGADGNAERLEKYLDRHRKLVSLLTNALSRLQRERAKMEVFLSTVDDAEMRLIIRLRCVNNMSWRKIGAEIGMDRRTASRKFYNFFSKK